MRRIGHYTIVEEIGRGGQATVYLAEDSRLRRRVALKVLSEQDSEAGRKLERFRREAEVASRLDHPGICPVYEAGVEDRVAFIAMRYVEGESLARRIARLSARDDPKRETVRIDDAATTPPPGVTTSTAGGVRLTREEIDEAVEIVEKCARALHAAHELGVIHRDVKPANVMVTPPGEPVLLDLGLARDESSDLATLTRSEDFFGTPAYMSPEQLTGQRIRPDRRTDVYALGATLYEAVTLRRPFEAPTREALFQAILTESPRDPRRINPRIPVELKIVIETALEKNRNRRYQTALAFAEDLRRVRMREPIRARPPGPLLRLRRWIQRRPATAAAIAGGVVALCLLGYAIGAAGKAKVESELKLHAEAERDQLEQRRRDEDVQRELGELESHFGTFTHAAPFILGKDRTFDHAPLARRYLAAYEAWGLPIAAPEGPGASIAVLGALRARDSVLLGTMLQSLETFAPVLAATTAPAESDPIAIAKRNVPAVLDAIQPDPWEREMRQAEADWRERGVDAFDPFLAEPVLRERSGRDLARLAGALSTIPARQQIAVEILDRAIEKEPGDFGLRVWRGGLALIAAQVENEPAAADCAHLHYSVARSLRPRSGLASMLLGIATVVKRDYRRGLELVDEATRLEPDSALIWLLAADFYGRGRMRDKAIAAARRAAELDPTLARAHELVQQLEAPDTRESR